VVLGILWMLLLKIFSKTSLFICTFVDTPHNQQISFKYKINKGKKWILEILYCLLCLCL
jgi:hypothetical protein